MRAGGKATASRGRARRKRAVRVERYRAREAEKASAAAASLRMGGAGGWGGEGWMTEVVAASMDAAGGSTAAHALEPWSVEVTKYGVAAVLERWDATAMRLRAPACTGMR